MVDARVRQLLLIWGLTAPAFADGVKSHCDVSSGSCKLEDELSLMQIKTDAVKRENSHEDSGRGGDIVLVEWNMQIDGVQKDGRYLFLKNRWWPWFSQAHADKTVLMHVSGTGGLQEQAEQVTSGMIGGNWGDLFGGDALHADGSKIPKPAYGMKALHWCDGNSDGIFGGKAWLSNHEKGYDKSSASCTKMYNKTNITDPPHSIKYGGRHYYALDSGKDTLLAARMFRSAVSGVMASGHDSDVLLGSWNVDPTDRALREIYGGIPHYPRYLYDPKHPLPPLNYDTSSATGSSNVVYAVDHSGTQYGVTCLECPGKPSRENVTDYLVSGPTLSVTALPGFKDKVMFDTWKRLGHNAPLSPVTVASSNMFPAMNATRGVHMPLVYLISATAPAAAKKKAPPPKHGPIKVKGSTDKWEGHIIGHTSATGDAP